MIGVDSILTFDEDQILGVFLMDKMSERGGVGGRGEREIGKGADLDRGISTLFRTANGSTVRL